MAAVAARGEFVSLDALGARTGFDPETLRDELGKLEHLDLLDVHGDGVSLPADFAERLDAAAARLGTAGAGDRDRERHRLDREVFRARAEEPEAVSGYVNVHDPEGVAS